MKKLFLSLLLLSLLGTDLSAASGDDYVKVKVAKELSLPGHLFENDRSKEIRVSFIVNEEGRADVTAVHAASKVLCDSVKREIEKMNFAPQEKSEERNLIIRVSLK